MAYLLILLTSFAEQNFLLIKPSLSCVGEGNGNSLQCSCLENPRDGGALWAAVYGVTQSRTQLKRLSSGSSLSCTSFMNCVFCFLSNKSSTCPKSVRFSPVLYCRSFMVLNFSFWFVIFFCFYPMFYFVLEYNWLAMLW